MTLLIPLGLLGLLSIAGLILIYIIKPNYQQKYISSTYVWALSLKLKKKRLPVSKLRNLLLILCQILFLVMCALALAQPAILTRAAITEREVIAIIDCSASMRASTDGQTRFQRAVNEVDALSGEVFNAGGYVSIFLASNVPSVIAQRATAESRGSVESSLESLRTEDSCSYGSADIDAAMALCEETISDNANAEIYLYTDTEYSYVPSGVTVVNVAEEGEWNAGILNAYTILEDNYYTLYVEVACYGQDREFDVQVSVQGVNAAESEEGVENNVSLETSVFCSGDQSILIVFRNQNAVSGGGQSENQQIIPVVGSDRFYSYKRIIITLPGLLDSFSLDNTFAVYGGENERVDILYYSPLPNNFFLGMIGSLSEYYRATKDVWDFHLTEIHGGGEPPITGYDIYIFEHEMPAQLPSDGIVILWDMDIAPEGTGITLGSIQRSPTADGIYLTRESNNPLLNNIMAGNIRVSRYTQLLSYDTENYEVLLSCDTSPVLLCRNDGANKVLIAPFSLHYSDLALRNDFVILFLNLIENWMPATVTSNAFSVYEEISLNSRGEELTVTNTLETNNSVTFDEFPATLTLNIPGTYRLTQRTDFGEDIIEEIYVKIPSSESNVWAADDTFRNPYLMGGEENYYDDLILYFAAAMVALLFIEWILQSRENL